jgi:serine/threonine protein kinase/outer membrane protein assembly factor BamB
VNDGPQDPVALGPYQILRKLGEGGMGTVFLALSPGFRLVALKMIRPEYGRDPGFRTRFRQEVTAAQKVSGMFTPPVLDADPDGTPQWLATSYVPAPSLHEVVRHCGVMNEPALNALGAGLAEALIAVHKAGIAHLDLKPGNVLIASDGPRVIDFGIARAFGTDTSPQTGGIVGTPGYMAPEQLVFGSETGPATDIFALGCVLTFAATGAHPFGPGEHDEILSRTKYTEPRLDGVPDSIRSLVSSCLAKEPDQRPSVETVLNSLLPAHPAALVPPALREELARRAREASTLIRHPPETTERNVSRRRFLVGSAAAGTTLGLVTAGGIRLLHRPAADQPDGHPSPTGAATAVPTGAAPVPLWRSPIPQTVLTTTGQPALAQMGGALVRWNSGSALGFDMATGSATWTLTTYYEAVNSTFLGVFGETLFEILATTDPSLQGFGSAGKTTVNVPVARAFDAAGASSTLSIYATYAGVGAADGVAVVAVTDQTTATAPSTVVAVDLTDGHALWSRQVNWGIDSPTVGGVMDEQHCYLQDGTSTLALELRTGAVKWSAQNTASAAADGIAPTMTVDSGALILISPDGTNLALDTASGAQLWTRPDLEVLALTTGNGRLYVLNMQYAVEAMGSRTGKTIWHTPNPVPDATSYTAGSLLALSASPSLLAVPLWTAASGMVVLAAADGRPLWAYRDPVATGSAWAVLALTDTVYGDSGAALYAFPASAS